MTKFSNQIFAVLLMAVGVLSSELPANTSDAATVIFESLYKYQYFWGFTWGLDKEGVIEAVVTGVEPLHADIKVLKTDVKVLNTKVTMLTAENRAFQTENRAFHVTYKTLLDNQVREEFKIRFVMICIRLWVFWLNARAELSHPSTSIWFKAAGFLVVVLSAIELAYGVTPCKESVPDHLNLQWLYTNVGDIIVSLVITYAMRWALQSLVAEFKERRNNLSSAKVEYALDRLAAQGEAQCKAAQETAALTESLNQQMSEIRAGFIGEVRPRPMNSRYQFQSPFGGAQISEVADDALVPLPLSSAPDCQPGAEGVPQIGLVHIPGGRRIRARLANAMQRNRQEREPLAPGPSRSAAGSSV